MAKLYKYILLVFTVALISSCSVNEVNVDNINNLSISEITSKHIGISMDVDIDNPNNFGFTISKVDLDFILNGKKLGKVYDLKNIHVPKKSKDTYTVVAKIKFNEGNSPGMALLGAFLNNKAVIQIKGKVYGRHFIFRKKIDVDEKRTIPIFNKSK